jgi:peptidoglycan/xylan/chitin deacetylase (PgdA/CDA1 family)
MFLFHRIDDVYACRPDLMAVLDTFVRAHVPVIVGVIPRRLTADMGAYLAANPGIIVYQHGLEHKSYAQPELGETDRDEFPASRTRADVKAALLASRALIETAVQRPVTGYIQPWNATAAQTLDVLAELGFTSVSTRRRHTVHPRLAALPVTVDTLSGYTPPKARPAAEIAALIAADRNARQPTGLVYHIKDLRPEDLDGYAHVIAQTASQVATPDTLAAFIAANRSR